MDEPASTPEEKPLETKPAEEKAAGDWKSGLITVFQVIVGLIDIITDFF